MKRLILVALVAVSVLFSHLVVAETVEGKKVVEVETTTDEVKNEIAVNFTLTAPETVTVSLITMTGEVIYEKDYKTLEAGMNNVTIPQKQKNLPLLLTIVTGDSMQSQLIRE